MNHDRYDNAYISDILNSVRTIAMVGASANDVRPSFFVLKYLLAKGFAVFPVNPGQAGKEILGRMTYARLADIPEPIDMVDIFRGVDAVPGIVDEALALNRCRRSSGCSSACATTRRPPRPRPPASRWS